METLEQFEKVTITKDKKHLVLYLDDRLIKCQTSLIIENDVTGLSEITVKFKLPTENISFLSVPIKEE